MKASRYRRAPLRSKLVCCLVGLVACLWVLVPAVADAQSLVVHIEEDWEMVLGTPDSNSTAPQVTCAFSPTGNTDALHSTFNLNHQSHPDFVPGGLQLQIWNGESPLEARKYPQDSVLAAAGETVRWTQCMELTDGMLTFSILNGSSSTWGSFGGQGYLTATIATGLSSLGGYDPSVSVANSGVGYAANRVESLVLKRVRLTLDDGTVLEDTTERVVHSQP